MMTTTMMIIDSFLSVLAHLGCLGKGPTQVKRLFWCLWIRCIWRRPSGALCPHLRQPGLWMHHVRTSRGKHPRTDEVQPSSAARSDHSRGAVQPGCGVCSGIDGSDAGTDDHGWDEGCDYSHAARARHTAVRKLDCSGNDSHHLHHSHNIAVTVGNTVAALMRCLMYRKLVTYEGLRERTEHPDILLFPPITQWCSISDVPFTGGRGVSDFSVLKYY